MFNTTNPALANDDAFHQFYGKGRDGGPAGLAAARPTTATLQGVVNKTAILVLVACIFGAGGYALVSAMPSITLISAVAAFVLVLGLGFLLCRNPAAAVWVAPIYAAVEGTFLGALTGTLDRVLAGMPALAGTVAAGEQAGARVSLAMPAFLVTVSVLLAMLGLYKARILRPTRRFQAVVGTAVAGIAITYALMFVLSLFGVQIPFLSLASAFQGGVAPLVGVGLSLLFLGVAALCLIVDFGRVEEIVESGAPRYMEWYAGFVLLVTLAWVYYEAVKLVFRLYLLFGSRE